MCVSVCAFTIQVNGGYDFPGSNSGIDLYALTGWLPEQVLCISFLFNRVIQTAVPRSAEDTCVIEIPPLRPILRNSVTPRDLQVMSQHQFCLDNLAQLQMLLTACVYTDIGCSAAATLRIV